MCLKSYPRARRAIAALLAALTALSPLAASAQSLTDRPLIATGSVKPNVMFTFDNNWTMGLPWVSNILNPDRNRASTQISWTDEKPAYPFPNVRAGYTDVGETQLHIADDPSVYSPTVNKLWYDNTRRYELPVHWDGTPLPVPDPSYTANEGFRAANDPDGKPYYFGRPDGASINHENRATNLLQSCEAWQGFGVQYYVGLTQLDGRITQGKYYPELLNGTGYVPDSTKPGRLRPPGGSYFGSYHYPYENGTYCTFAQGNISNASGVPVNQWAVSQFAFWYRYVQVSKAGKWTDFDGNTQSCSIFMSSKTPWCNHFAAADSCDGSAASLRDPQCYERIDLLDPNYWRYSGFARKSFPKAAGRTDCAGASCTWDEEIRNYSIWYSYYRLRSSAMKAYLGRQFAAIPAGSAPFRIGFNVTTKAVPNGTPDPEADFNDLMTTAGAADLPYAFLEVDDWTVDQKKKFFRMFYGAGPNWSGSSPYAFKTAVKIGEYFRGKGTTDPQKFSCQPAMHVFATDTAQGPGAPGAFVKALPTIDEPYPGDNNGDVDGYAKNPLATRASASIDVTGSRNTFPDATIFYASKDLRSSTQGNCKSTIPGIDLCEDNVVMSAKDPQRQQHVRTSVIGIGFEGKPYREDYESSTDPANPIWKIKQGLEDWTSPMVFGAGWGAIVDEYWHAAINGRGTYFNPIKLPDLGRALSGVLGDLVAGSPASAAGSVVSTPVLVAGQTAYSYGVRFFPGIWAGDVYRRVVDPTTGADVLVDDWNARTELDRIAAGTGWDDQRKIATISAGKGVALRFGNLSSAQKTALGPTTASAMWTMLPAAKQAAFGGSVDKFREAVLNYLRGDRTHEQQGSGAQVFRKRANILGDIVGSEAVYVQAPREKYNEGANDGYADFMDKYKDRPAMLYVGANDGMVHAIDANTGEERWAYMPGAIFRPDATGVAALAFPEGGTPPFAKQFYVDGTPTVSDVDFNKTAGVRGGSADWRTLLVGGLNKGGRAVYALDVTAGNAAAHDNDAAKKVLWEFDGNPKAGDLVAVSPDELGYTFGKPVITKSRAWGWVVVVSSGYGNADGKGYVFVLNARTGNVLFKFTTNEGSPAAPIGLAKLAGYSASFADGTVDNLYGGDLQGNLWRFDLTALGTPPDNRGIKIAKLTDPKAGDPQPITTRPRVEFDPSTGKRFVFVGTGKLLDATDAEDTAPASTQIQSMYAIADGDRYAAGAAGTPITRTSLVNLTGSLDGDTAAKNGWVEDFEKGERVMIEPRFDVGVILYVASKPSADECSAGFSSRLMARKTGDGKSVLYDVAGTTRLRSLSVPQGIVKIDTITLASGKTVARYTTASGEGRITSIEPSRDSKGMGRVSWREVVTQ